uniref:Signal transducer and activator of transcription 2 n=1 Tax=Nothobranchius furzeri TaxID=105023 RepID=A0A8C6LJM3_NOTFU
MSQWERLMLLSTGYIQQLHDLYDRDGLPMDVRHHLSAWIEKQDWARAAQDHEHAVVLFQVLLENLDIQHSRFVQEESFLQQHNIRRYKQNFQMYQDEPCSLAETILWFLVQEKKILSSADLDEQVWETPSLTNVHVLSSCFTCFCLHSSLKNLTKLLGRAEDLINLLVNRELVDWQRRQQKACIGAPDNACLDQLEKWFTCVAVCLFQVREFLNKLEELVGKVSYENDPVKAQRPHLLRSTDGLLEELLKSSFVVETQPSMPQGKGPLVLRTNTQFSVKTRLLVKFPELNHCMKVEVSMIREAPHIKGYRRFNVLGTKTKALNMAESHSGGMVADFRHLTLKEQKSGGGGKGVSDISLSVTEELHIIHFNTVFEHKGFSVELQASSLPVVIISNSSQQQSAWASVLWFNMLSQDPKVSLPFFANVPAAPWPQFADMLSWQFLSATKRGLDDAQLGMIAHKLFGKFFRTFNISFIFCKEKSLLKKMMRGTFLLRFSESIIGGITFSWVEINSTDEPDIKTVQPFTKADLSQIPFHEIIRNFKILEADNIPENPLRYLYPNIPKDEAFGKYYSEKCGDDSPYIKYIKTKLVFVSKENTLEARSPMSCDMTQGEGLEPISGPCGEAAGESWLSLLSNPAKILTDQNTLPSPIGTV